MKRLILALLILIALFQTSVNATPPNLEGWYTNGVIANPAALAVLAISPALSKGYRNIGIVCSYGVVAGGCVLTRLASDGTTPVHSHTFTMGANTNFAYTFKAMWNEDGEFWAVSNLTVIAGGGVQGSLFIE